ncbi:MAG: HD domain-containing protein [Acholeplasmataceae bacterium]
MKKVFRDPIYGYIHIIDPIIHQLIDSKAFQRLRRISQLSGVKMVFHGAEHSRFNHSLGVYALACKVLEINESIQDHLSEYERILFLTSALLHDVGHGAYSHSFERVFHINHEQMTASILLGDKEISAILDAHNENLKTDISSVILKTHKFPIIESLISSQLDIDRLDYLLRDAYYTGISYGKTDMDRIIRMLTIKDGKIVYKEGALHAIENYLISRYHMYFQVYYHPAARNHEVILEKIYTRINALFESLNDPYLNHLKQAALGDLDSYLEIDDYYVNALIKRFSHSADEILSGLCNRFLNRKLFNFIEFSHEDEIKPILAQQTSNYHFQFEDVYQQAYKKEFDVVNQIFILNKQGLILPIEEVSSIVKGLIDSGNKRIRRLYYE